jgi:hypothetical protein
MKRIFAGLEAALVDYNPAFVFVSLADLVSEESGAIDTFVRALIGDDFLVFSFVNQVTLHTVLRSSLPTQRPPPAPWRWARPGPISDPKSNRDKPNANHGKRSQDRCANASASPVVKELAPNRLEIDTPSPHQKRPVYRRTLAGSPKTPLFIMWSGIDRFTGSLRWFRLSKCGTSLRHSFCHF